METNLISVPQLTEDGCTCLLEKCKAIVTCSNTTITSERNEKTGMWTIPINKNETENIDCKEKSTVSTNKNTNNETELKNLKHTGITKSEKERERKNVTEAHMTGERNYYNWQTKLQM